jgi:hypothetical protein
MAISLTCSCGKFCRVKDTLAGKKVRCPECGGVLVIPLRDQDVDLEQAAAELLLTDAPGEERAERKDRSAASPLPPPSRSAPPYPPPIQSAPPQPVAKAPPKAAARAKTQPQHAERERGPRVVFEEGWFGSLNAGVIGGLLTMLLAIVWFVGGLWAGRIFFYPPILLVLGFIAVIKGIFGGE